MTTPASAPPRDLAALAAEHYAQLAAVGAATAATAVAAWAALDLAAIVASWVRLLPDVLSTVLRGQVAAATLADPFVVRALAAQVARPPVRLGRVVPARLAGVASDGRDLATLLYQPAIRALVEVGSGAAPQRAHAAGAVQLDMLVRTQVADAGRVAVGVAVAARPTTGYVRMLVPPSCSRCVVLAGRWYRWNAGFARHPRCDCIGVPAIEDTDDDVRTDPKAHFRSLSTSEQDRVFGFAGAQAIRDGADIAQVVNARRGMSTASVGGRRVKATTEGTTRRGLFGGYEIDDNTGALRRRDTTELVRRAGERVRRAKAVRLMPEQIYAEADGDRAEALRLLRRNGYIR